MVITMLDDWLAAEPFPSTLVAVAVKFTVPEVGGVPVITLPVSVAHDGSGLTA